MDNWCEGGNSCKFHEFPYKAEIPIIINGKRETRLFRCKEDVQDVIKLLIKETEENNSKGKSFDVGLSVSKQLPFFSCMNILYDKDAQKYVEKCVYCQDFNVAPYDGNFGDQPKKWVDRSFIIKKALAKREESLIKKNQKEQSNG